MSAAFRAYGWVVEFGNDLRAFFRIDEDEKAMKFATTHNRGGAVIEHGIRKTVYEMVEIPDTEQSPEPPCAESPSP